ncbi:transglycosylase family protein [Streptomyces sp. NBS 14/10]|nr:transglycosylase family protein [Streptomyces sp. NBS 14/10]KAK1181445.1 transglycosylase family protein [Streptomyces sp. NBS 14/10]
MRSGNGRHRRPRQAPAIVVAAGVTGASIAMPLFGAVGAQAADTTQTWDRVAECESGGMWSANGGNGFYGGLQITLDMWRKYGGQQYAPRPDLASRSQQIAIAQAILADRGPDAWPSCALDAGLAGLADALDVNPGGKGTPEAKELGEPTGIGDSDTDEASDNSSRGDRSDSSDSSGSSEDSDTSDKTGKSDPSATPDGKSGEKGGKSGDSGEASRDEGDSASGKGDERSDRDAKGEDSATSPTGRHRGTPDAREQDSAGTADDDARASGRHASRDDAERTEIPVQPLGREDYTVRGGDNLSDIADDRDDQKADGGWPELFEAGEPLIGIDPDLIHPGQRLDLGAR